MSSLESHTQFWSYHSKKEITEIEDVCSRAKKIIKGTKRLPWEER